MLILPACSSVPLKHEEPVGAAQDKKEAALSPELQVESLPHNVINPVDNWDYPGKFYPVSGEHLAHFFNSGTQVTNCQLQTLNDIAVANIQSFMDGKKMIVEEKRNFIQFDMKPGTAWLLVKNQNPEVALHECLKLQKYLLETFNFTIKK
jgi:hypothetical protein